jgi:hypothetical protein
MWSAAIGKFNSDAKQPINTVWSYGGDMEYYPQSAQPYNSYFPAASQKEAATYRNKTAGVKYIGAVLDGRMDGGQSYSPDLSKLTMTQINAWADVTAETYCSFDTVDGIQLDLEPSAGKYYANLVVFISRLSENLRSKERNCVSVTHPEGRSLSTFTLAENITPALWTALGPNGYLVISGYDLSSAPAGTPSTVNEYTTALGKSIDAVVKSVGATNGSFFIGIPAAASCHEFEVCAEEVKLYVLI